MKILLEGDRNILKLLCKHIDKTCNYVPSKYLICLEVDEGVLLGNTLTGELVLLSQVEKEYFDRIPQCYKDEFKDLIVHHFLVPELCDEFNIVNQLRSILLTKKKNEDTINHYNILPTTACNARCFYCYQSGTMQVSMDKEVADSLVEFIASHNNNKKVILSWFGGEPTLGCNRIDQICRKLDLYGVQFESDMISNGYLFDEKLVKKAKDIWKLMSIQITLDGSEQKYIETKQYIGVQENPYKRVLRNVDLLLDADIEVRLRLNIDAHNSKDILVLIDELVSRFNGRKKLHVYVWKLDEGKGYSPIHHTETEREELDLEFERIQGVLESRGWPQIWNPRFPMLTLRSCMADDSSFIQCAPNGVLSKCEDKIFEHTVGNIKDGIINKEGIDWWSERVFFEECRSCPLFPSCNRLLKNCPTKKAGCTSKYKARKIEEYHKLINNVYKKLKDTGKI